MGKAIRNHQELEVYQRAFATAMEVFQLSQDFPAEERYSLTDQVRRSSRSVCANLAEAWRKRRYEAAFVSKLSDAEAEAAETQVWLEFAVKCGYLTAARARLLYARYNQIIGTIVGMITHTDTWLLPNSTRRR
jgi:four helix bundle protein